MTKILVIDDRAGMRRSLAILLKKEGFQVEEADNGNRAIECMNGNNFDLVITDMKMSPGTGLDVLYYMREKHPNTDVIIMTGYGTVDSAVLAMKMGAFDYISKPFKNEEILHRVRKAINHMETEREFTYFPKDSEGVRKRLPIIGKSPSIKEMISLIEKFAKVDLPVLITGETGTGKNLVAKTVHGLSSRKNKPYVSINCAAVPENLLESELFGHTKGAFTGALLERKGMFEEAEGGSLLLDEIGSMPISMQAKLLDVLQDGAIRRVGSNKSKETDVRILAATNKDLERAVVEGNFREDLYYRIKVAHIHVSPLREHPEDILYLAQHFIESIRKKFNKPDLNISSEVMDFLYHYEYPGNIRELDNMIKSAAAVASNSMLSMEDLSLSLTNKMFEVPPASEEKRKPRTMNEWEKNLIMKSIEKHSHNLTRVCMELGIGRTTLWRRMKKYGID